MFLEGVIYQLSAFAMKSGVAPEDVVVRIFLTNGDFVVSRGLKTIPPFGGNDWGMLLPDRSETSEASVVRESDILKVQLEVAGIDLPIGFLAESLTQRPK
jgi:hypothetical protein